MMDRETNEERQENELRFLQEVYGATDLRVDDPWKIKRPPEYEVVIYPVDEVNSQHPTSLTLNVRYPVNYPDEAVHLHLTGSKSISDDQLKVLQTEIEKMASESIGNEVIFDIVHHLEDVLHKKSQRQISLHEEMVIRRQQEVDEQKRRDEEKRLQSEKERREIEAQIQEQQKKMLKEAHQQQVILRKQTALYKVDEEDSVFDEPDAHNDILENSVATLFARENTANITKSTKRLLNGDLLDSIAAKAPVTTCSSHIYRGKCIGHSDNGYSVYIGMDNNTGDLVAVYEWILRCKPAKNDISRRQKQVNSINTELQQLQQLRHPHLVQYLEMTSHTSDNNIITVQILMEYVGGGSVSNHMRSSNAVPVNLDSLRRYTKQLLEAIYCLHSHGTVHKDIKLSSLLLDSIGHLKLAGAGVVKRLCDLYKSVNQLRPPSSSTTEDDHLVNDPIAWAEVKGGKKGDVLKLGLVVLCMALGQVTVSYPPVIPNNFPESLKDFILKCTDANEHSRSTIRQLLQHPFVQATSLVRSPSESYFTLDSQSSTDTCKNVMKLLRRDSVTGTPIVPKNMIICSRLRTEFEEIEFLGKGGFGDVVKVRNHLDGNVYAIKRIELNKENKLMYKKITREVRLLSNLNHENVVRYYNSWIETYSDSGDDLKKSSSLEEEDEDDYDDDDDDDDDFDYDDDIEQMLELSIEGGTNNRTLSRSSSHDSYIMFEAQGSDHDDGNDDHLDHDDLSTLDDTFTSSDPLASIDSDLAKTKFLVDSSDGVVFADSSSQQPIKQTPSISTLKPQQKSRSSGHLQYLYIQMEYCEKNTLRQLIDTGELHKNMDDVWRLFRELVEGLAHIHSRHVIHRDLKPGNIFLSSSGHIKIGDFGLATTFTFHRQSSFMADSSIMEQLQSHHEVTGPVGTALYTSPEVLYSTGPPSARYSDKIDIFSLGIIFFEMCHPPWETQMERYEVICNLRKENLLFPSSFDERLKSTEAAIIRMLLAPNARDRPSSKELISKFLPPQMEEADFNHALEQTVSMRDSTRYHLLLDRLFSQPVSTLSQVLYSMDKSKFSIQLTAIQHKVHQIMSNIFTRHGAVLLKTPLLLLKEPMYDDTEHLVNLMDKRGSLVMLPFDLRVPFARYVYNHDITYLKRYTISRVFRENKLVGAHPREVLECAFDIITPSPGSFFPDAEVMYVVSEVLAQFPELQQHNYKVLLTHTNLLPAILKHCGIAADMIREIYPILYSLSSGTIKESQLEEKFTDVKLSAGVIKQLLNFVKSEVSIEEAKIVLEPLVNNRSASDGSSTIRVWQEIETVVSFLKLLGIKEPVYLHLGLVPHFKYFDGIIFQYVGTRVTKARSRKRTIVLAAGGRYDELVRKGKTELSAVGVSISAELIFSTISQHSRMKDSEYVHARCSVLVCWTGQRNFQKECIELAKQLWDNNVNAEILYDSLQMDTVGDVQDLCVKNLIRHFVMFDDLYPSKRQVQLWSMEDKTFTDKKVNITEVIDRVLHPEKFEQEKNMAETPMATVSRTNILSNNIAETPTMANTTVNIVQVNFIHSETGKMPAHQKRKYQDQAYSKMHPVLQRIGMRSAELLIVDLKPDALSFIAAEVNKLLQLENNDVNISQLKTATESLESVSRKYLNRILEAIEKSLSDKRSPVLVLFSCSCDHYQLILDALQ